MKKLTMMALTSLALVAVAAPALAFGPVDVDAGLALNGKYVWRGMVQTPDAVVQPELSLNVLGFSAGIWGNMDTNDVNGLDQKFTEVDYMLGYEMSLPLINFDTGFIYYDFPNSEAASTTEFYLGAAVNVLLSPSLKIYQDIDEVKGAYWEASVSHSVALNPTTNVDLTAGFGLGSKGYIKGYFGAASLLPTVPEVPGNASLTDFFFHAGVPFHPVPMFTVTPSVSYSSLSGDVKDIVDAADGAAYHGDSDAFVWGLSATFSF